MTTAHEFLVRGHVRGEARLAERQRVKLAAMYTPHPLYDRIIARRATELGFWEQLDATTRISVAMYEAHRAAHDAGQGETT